jgi:hypothetical protein
MKIFFALILSISIFSISAQSFYLIVHGTWCPQFSWHMPGGDFHDALVQATDRVSVLFFIWSGYNNHAARIKAADQLVRHIETYVPYDAELNVITHSHGSNVAILASHIMEHQQSRHRIHHFYALGTPVSTVSYFPNMNIIKYFYNMFSFSDMVQTVFGIFNREFPAHERIANLFITINGREPSHSDLHAPCIAYWLPQLPEKLRTNRIGNFDQFTFEKPGLINFYTDKPPIYQVDEHRVARQQRDILMLLNFKRTLAHEPHRIISHSIYRTSGTQY